MTKALDKLKNTLSKNGDDTDVLEKPMNGKAIETEVTADDILKGFNLQKTQSVKDRKVVPFPIDALPPRTRDIIKTFARCDGFPIEYYATNTLVAVSSLLGVGYKAKYKHGHEHYPILYAVLVGDSSAGKSMSMKPIFSPIYKFEKEYADEYNAAHEKWRDECYQVKMNNIKDPLPPEPVSREIIMDNYTLESLIKTMWKNPRGLLILVEEALAWLKNMNAYRAGSDEQFFLKNWDAAFTKVTRTGAETIIVRNPNASIVGGVQPALLHEFLSNGRGQSGFSARLLFAYPEETIAPYDNDVYPDASVYESFYNIMKWIHKLPNRIVNPTNAHEKPVVETATIDCDEDAKRIYRDYFNHLTDQTNEADDDRIKSLLGKLKSYCMRFALIIEMLRRAEESLPKASTNEFPPPEMPEGWDAPQYQTFEDVQNGIQITAESMKAAKALTEYFKYTGSKVLQRYETAVDELKIEQQNWYRSLPMGGIRFSIAVESAVKCGVSKSTVYRLLNDNRLFKKVGETYERRIA